ncbi:MAG: choice-of-anchor D domain-containing protein [Ignavibacteriae bacterium]|nr:choice-of-anchor D domain-containing protein [Ignavibacteriota bacterium]
MNHATQSTRRFKWAALIAIIILGFSRSSLSYATIFPVSNTGDAGIGTLRWALQQANAPFSGPDTILFTLPGSGPFVILPLSQLPPLVDPAGVYIDGYSQPGSSPGANPPSTSVILIVIDGALAGAAHGFVITCSNNTIRGMNIRNFQQDGIRIEATTAGTFNNVIFGNFVGTTHTGVAAMPNGLNMLRPWAGVDILADPMKLGTATNNIVRRNLISGNFAQGVSISSCPPADVSFNHVDSNRIGTDVSGMLALGNRHDGVYIGEAAHDNFIRHNVISANDTDGVSIVGYVDAHVQWYTHSNHVIGNLIGLAADGNTPLPNGRHGVCIGMYGSIWLLGFAPSNDVSINHIAYNGGNGVVVWEHPLNQNNADKNRISSNSMYANRRQGIDLDNNGISINDPGDLDAGANQTLNMPVITNATSSGGAYMVRGNITIDTNPAQAVVEVFIASWLPPGTAQGRILLGITTPDAAGNWSLTGAGTLTATDTVVATVIDVQNNTSEFSAPFPVNGPVISGPSLVSFGTVIVGRSTTRSAIVRNTGASTLVLSSITCAPPDFSILSGPIPITIPAADSATLLLRYGPSSAGVSAGICTITSNAANAPVLGIPLSGIGVDSAAEFTMSGAASGLDFGLVAVGDSGSRFAVFSNTGNAALTVSILQLLGTDSLQYSVSSAIPIRVQAGAVDSVRVRFRPASTGIKQAVLALGSNDPNLPLARVPLRGTGTAQQPALSVQPSALSFDTVIVGSQRERSAVVTNTGTATLSITSQQLIGADTAEFTITRFCAAALAPGGTDTVRVRFAPGSTGVKNAALRFTSNDPVTPSTDLALRGVGVAPQTARISVTPSSLVFGRVIPAGSAIRSVRVENTGGAALTINTQLIGGQDSAVFTIVHPAQTPLGPGGIDSIRVLYAPLALGVHAARIDIASSDPQTPGIAVPLSGICAHSDGAALQLSRNSIPFGTVPMFTSREETLRVTSIGAASLILQQQLLHGPEAGSFSIIRAAATPLATGASSDVYIRLSPITPGSKSAFFRIISNDAVAPLLDVPLSGSTVGVSATGIAPTTPSLQAYPQPVVHATRFLLRGYTVGERVHAYIHDLLGRTVRVLALSRINEDTHATEWDVLDAAGRRVAAGTYCCIVRDNSTVTRVLVLVR